MCNSWNLSQIYLLTCAGGEVSGLCDNSRHDNVVISLYAGGITDTLLHEKSNFTNFNLLNSEKEAKCKLIKLYKY